MSTDDKTKEQVAVIKELALEEKAVNLAARVKQFEHEGNFVKLYISTNKEDLQLTQNALNEIGISEIFHEHTDRSGASPIGHSFVLNYEGSKQQKAIDNLEQKVIRMSALNKLFYNGGFKLSHIEQEFFDKQAAHIAALKLSGNVK